MKRFQLYPTTEDCMKITDIHTGKTIAIVFDLDAAFECEKALNKKQEEHNRQQAEKQKPFTGDDGCTMGKSY